MSKILMSTLSRGIVLNTCSSGPSMSRLKKWTVGFPRARRMVYTGKHWRRRPRNVGMGLMNHFGFPHSLTV